MKLLTFDVGGTEIKYAIIEGALSISDKGYIPTPLDSFDSFVNVVKEIYMPYKGTVDGIAMCLPGCHQKIGNKIKALFPKYLGWDIIKL
ncbi:MAG: hypothetical protein IKG47_10365 [Oscillospiraceae bacterium]|nr:hypothetical protein [Oscillospiraceae bacterium]